MMVCRCYKPNVMTWRRTLEVSAPIGFDPLYFAWQSIASSCKNSCTMKQFSFVVQTLFSRPLRYNVFAMKDSLCNNLIDEICFCMTKFGSLWELFNAVVPWYVHFKRCNFASIKVWWVFFLYFVSIKLAKLNKPLGWKEKCKGASVGCGKLSCLIV